MSNVTHQVPICNLLCQKTNFFDARLIAVIEVQKLIIVVNYITSNIQRSINS